jgi:bifunctional non-homologous end joining protein LigD
MLARGVSELPQGSDWIYEVKWDGYRALAIKYGDAVDLLSRKGNSLATDFPSVVAAVRQLPVGVAMLDGEIVALDDTGRPQFQLLQNRRSARDGQIVFYAYDLLQVDGDDLRRCPLAARKERLAELVSGSPVRFSANLPGTPKHILAQAHSLGLEGIVAKRRDSSYDSGERSGAWLKLKLSPEQEFVIGGYKPGKPLESLLVGYYQGEELMFAGKVRQGLNPQNRVSLWRTLQPLLSDRCPFANVPNSKKSHFGEGITPEQMKELKWVKPKLVAQVSFAEWTTSGNLRHATFLGLRDDKSARRVIRE